MTTRHPDPDPETYVPADETPAARCQYCERPFKSERLRALHLGEYHEDERTEAERRQTETALEDERDDLFFYQLKVTIALGLIYSASAMLAMVLLGS